MAASTLLRLSLITFLIALLSCSRMGSEKIDVLSSPQMNNSTVATLRDPGDIDLSKVSGFVIKAKSNGKVYLRALDKSGVEFGRVFAVDESEIKMYGVKPDDPGK